jgi:hypothetical protein
MEPIRSEMIDNNWKSISIIGGISALLAVIVGITEICINFVPGGNVSPVSILIWFRLFNENWFLGLRDLGLLNIILTALGIIVILSIYGVLRKENEPFAKLALIIAIIGSAIYYSTNRAFPMLELSNQYALATSESQKTIMLAAGQAMISVGKSHTPGTFIGLFFNELSFIVMSLLMIKSKVFNSAIGIIGIIGFGLLLIFEIIKSFISGFDNYLLLIALVGGLGSMVWYILIARKLFTLYK